MTVVERNRRPYANVLETVGWTPLIRLNRVTRGMKTPVYAKADFCNPEGRSRTERVPIIGGRSAGPLSRRHNGEGTSGNTDGLAIAERSRDIGGLHDADQMSQEKVRMLKAFAPSHHHANCRSAEHPDN